MSIRDDIAGLVDAAARAAQAAGEIPAVVLPEPTVERPARPEHGDYASNLPLRLARSARQSPMQLAETIAKHMPGARGRSARCRWRRRASSTSASPTPGWPSRSNTMLSQRRRASSGARLGGGKKVQVEFVSANPTGPLHVGNGRWASIGDSLARVAGGGGLPRREGVPGQRRRHAGRRSSADTLFARYQQLFGRDVEIPRERLPRRVRDRAGAGDQGRGRRPLPRGRGDAAGAEAPGHRADDGAHPRRPRWRWASHYDVWFSEQTLYRGRDTYKTAMDLLRAARRRGREGGRGLVRQQRAGRGEGQRPDPLQRRSRPTSRPTSPTTTTSSSSAASTRSSTSGAPTTRATSRA